MGFVCFVYVFDNYRNYLARDVYDDMMLDAVKPQRDTFHSLIACSMKGVRLQDAFYFRDQMQAMGLVPDVLSYSLYILFIILVSKFWKCYVIFSVSMNPLIV